jgi:lipid-A-disaccharide synthase
MTAAVRTPLSAPSTDSSIASVAAGAGAGAIMIVAGEPSGDMHGAALAQALRAQAPGVSLVGMGGPAMAAAGVDRLVDITAEASVGFIEALGRVGLLWRAFRRLRRHMAASPPRALVLIDFPEFNLRLARVARRLGIPVVYFIPPQIWAWRRGRIRTIRRLVSLVLAVFPFERALYRGAGVPVELVGHPLRDRIAGAPSRADARRALGLGANDEVLGLLPGSRRVEIEAVLPAMRDAVALIRRERPSARFVLALAPTVERRAVEAALGPSAAILVVEARTYAVMRAADLLLVTSGTATLEAALLGTPMVVCYRLSALSETLVRVLVRVPWVSLPNLLAGRAVVPELYRQATTGPGLARAALELLGDEGARAAQREAFGEISDQMGDGEVAARAAHLVLAQATASHRRGAPGDAG